MRKTQKDIKVYDVALNLKVNDTVALKPPYLPRSIFSGRQVFRISTVRGGEFWCYFNQIEEVKKIFGEIE